MNFPSSPFTRKPARRTAAVLLAAGIAILGSSAARADEADSSLRPYSPQPVSPPKDASYLLPDGSIYIAGNDIIRPAIDKFNALFVKTHPGFKFTVYTPGPGGAGGVTSGKSAIGPNGRDFTFRELDAFTSRWGYPPTVVQFGWDNNPAVDAFPPDGKYPPGIWVNVRNPARYLTIDQASAIFTTGSPHGSITHWSQVDYDEGPVGKNGGDWSNRAIHVYLPNVTSAPIANSTRFRLGGHPWTPRAEYLPAVEDIINAVANDPFGIALAGWFPNDWGWEKQSELASKIRFMALTEGDNSPISHGGNGDLYPLAGGIHFMVNRPPGKPMEPWIREYMRLILSKDGQDIVGSLTKSDGLIPLDPDDVPKELAKLE